MKKIFYFLFLSLFVFTSCNQDEEIIDLTLKKGKQEKVTICHKGKIITVSGNALKAHIKHGDAIDLDGDGYYNKENVCSEGIDCDDSNAEVNPGMEEVCGNDIDDDCDGDGDEDCRTYVPNDGFEQFLINEGYDDVLDDYVLTSNISNVKELHIPTRVIPKPFWGDLYVGDLTGLEDFVSLEILSSSGPIDQYDFSKNIKLEKLTINTNTLTAVPILHTLNITKNVALNYLSIGDNNWGNLLTSLDLTNNVALSYLRISNSKITSLDLSYCTVLEEFILYDDSQVLLKLNVKNGNNTLITNFHVWSESLTCIQVDNASDANAGDPPYDSWLKDDIATYSENCGF